MDDIRQTAIDRFQAYLARRQFSPHTVASYTSDLRLFFAEIAVPLARVSFHQKRREAPAFMPGRDRRWARWAQCPRAQQDPRSTRALNGRGNCREGSPGIHAGEDVPFLAAPSRAASQRLLPALARLAFLSSRVIQFIR